MTRSFRISPSLLREAGGALDRNLSEDTSLHLSLPWPSLPLVSSTAYVCIGLYVCV